MKTKDLLIAGGIMAAIAIWCCGFALGLTIERDRNQRLWDRIDSYCVRSGECSMRGNSYTGPWPDRQ